jgi:hypothetical protein
MQCSVCLSAERLRVSGPATIDPVERADHNNPLLCATCGGPLERTGGLGERLLQKLAQLARFGLVELPATLSGAGRHRA